MSRHDVSRRGYKLKSGSVKKDSQFKSISHKVNKYHTTFDGAKSELVTRFDWTAWKKIKYWVDLAPEEVSGLGLVRRDTDGAYHVRDAYLLKQKNTSSFTDIDDNAVHELILELLKQDEEDEGSRLEDLKFWWHSHVDGSVSWSSQDDYNVATKLFGEDLDPHVKKPLMPWFLSSVFNKRGDVNTRLDVAQPWLTINKVPHQINSPPLSEEIKQFCKKELDEKASFARDTDPFEFDDFYPHAGTHFRRGSRYMLKSNSKAKSLHPSYHPKAALIAVPGKINVHRHLDSKEAKEEYEDSIKIATEAMTAVAKCWFGKKEKNKSPSPMGYIFNPESFPNQLFQIKGLLSGRLNTIDAPIPSLVLFVDPELSRVVLSQFSSVKSSSDSHEELTTCESGDSNFFSSRFNLTVDVELSHGAIGVVFSSAPYSSKDVTKAVNKILEIGQEEYGDFVPKNALIRSYWGKAKQIGPNRPKEFSLSHERIDTLYKELEQTPEREHFKALVWLSEKEPKLIKSIRSNLSDPLSMDLFSQDLTEAALDIKVALEKNDQELEKSLLSEYAKVALLALEIDPIAENNQEIELDIEEEEEENQDLHDKALDYAASQGEEATLDRIHSFIKGPLASLVLEDLQDLGAELLLNHPYRTEDANGSINLVVQTKEELLNYIYAVSKNDPIEAFGIILSCTPNVSYCTGCYQLLEEKEEVCSHCKRTFDSEEVTEAALQ